MISANHIFNINTSQEFDTVALDIFKFQFENNPVYRSYCDLLYKHPSDVKTLEDIPFLPIQFFKSHKVLSQPQVEKTFTSSGTTGQVTSKHHVSDIHFYEQSFTTAFKQFYGNIEDYAVLALLPSYLEREGSSLIYMANHFITHAKHPKSGFYLDNLSALKNTLLELESHQQKTLLLGVSFALLDLVEAHTFNLNNTIVMETGGMKGRRKELIRAELHARLKHGFGVPQIHSEYGMTELLSQAYSKGDGRFVCPPWMRVLTRDPEDPLTLLKTSSSGGLNIIDLANINSCSFIATQDLGKVYPDQSFEVLGRFDHSDIRGCNLMAL
ncbi:acyl transferase [Mangrovimonas yunxiaonensis]|uniref:Acyl transferase n=1 Tax=Mangrovimonas yunxiaonensis TaxID=1197477 RepID=A0A084TLH0_9FLAO|nr:acyltransferase [Mangrovimonas yunxiaonensis]KFB01556.1 acyl transferase [Mangrovimonas yunxiaonensis]GGH35977.1 acyltransferase [Mangrovimonas yunxiaonensis]